LQGSRTIQSVGGNIALTASGAGGIYLTGGSIVAGNDLTTPTSGGTVTINSTAKGTDVSQAGLRINGNSTKIIGYGDISIYANAAPSGLNTAGAGHGVILYGSYQTIRSYGGKLAITGYANSPVGGYSNWANISGGITLWDGSNVLQAKGDLTLKGVSMQGIGSYLTVATGSGGGVISDNGNISIDGLSNSIYAGTYIRMPITATNGSVYISGAGNGTAGIAQDLWYGSVSAKYDINMIGYATGAHGINLSVGSVTSSNGSVYLSGYASSTNTGYYGIYSNAINASATNGSVAFQGAKINSASTGSGYLVNAAATLDVSNNPAPLFAVADSANMAYGATNGVYWTGNVSANTTSGYIQMAAKTPYVSGTMSSYGLALLATNQNYSFTASNSVSSITASVGSGTITYTNTGPLNIGSFNGIVGITAGTLTLTAGGLTDTADAGITVTNASTVTINNATGSYDYSGVIAGPVSVTKSGAGTQILSGTNTNTGSTTVSAGTLAVGAGGTTGAIGGDASVASGTTLIFNRSDNVSYSGAISGAGAFTKQGAATLTLTGANNITGTTTISGGILQVGAGGTTGALGTGAVTNNGGLIVNRSDALTIGGAISGTGYVTKLGAGTLTLTGNGSYSGSTTISGGTLVFQNDAPTTSSSGFLGTGALTVQPNGTSFSSAFSTANWKISNTLTGLTLGKSGNTADVTLSLKDASGNDVTWLNPVTLYGGNLYVNTPVSWSSDTTSTLQASSNIYINANLTATGNAAGLKIFYGGSSTTLAPTASTFYELNLANYNQINLTGTNPTLWIANHQYTLYNSVASLLAMGTTSSTYAALKTDLSMAGTTYTSSAIAQFSGTLDGLGHSIDGYTLKVSTSGNHGFFGKLVGATVSNLGLSNVYISTSTTDTATGSYEYIGGLAGLVTSTDGTDTKTGSTYINGVWTTGSISKVAGTYTRAFFAGGLIGKQRYGSLYIDRSFSTAVVSQQGAGSTSYTAVGVGGLVGDVSGTINSATQQINGQATFRLSRSYATGSVISGFIYNWYGTGGLVGVLYTADGQVTDSVGYGNAVATTNVSYGGIVGVKYGPTETSISNSYTTDSTIGATGTNLYSASTIASATSNGTQLPAGFSGSKWKIGLNPMLLALPPPPVTLFVTETQTSGTYGNLNFAYSVKDKSNNTVVFGSGAYANLSVSGTPIYSLDSSSAAGANQSLSYITGLSATNSGSDGVKYLLVPSSTPTTYTINPGALTITANNQSTEYGTSLSLGTSAYTYSGLGPRDSLTGVTLQVASSATVAATTNAGTYSIVPSAATGTGLTNYNITYANGSLTVNTKALTLGTLNVANKTYDATTTATVTTAATPIGLVNSDAVTVNTAGIVATFADADVGTGKTVSLSSIGLSGAKAANYTVSSTASSTANITAKTLEIGTVTVPTTKVYDASTSVALSGTAALLATETAGTVHLLMASPTQEMQFR